jgi:glycosyltransferase involved in cell wall biosynthesis
MTKTILVITDNVKGQVNGVVTTFSQIEKYAVMNGYRYKTIDPNNFKNFSCPGYSEVKLALPIGIGRKIKEINPDFIHIATEGPIGLAAKLWLDINGYRYNTSYHTKFPEFLNQLYKIPEFITYSYLRWFHKNSSRVLVTTETMVKELKHNRFKQNLVVWTRGVDGEIFQPNTNKETFNKKILLSVGRVSKEKNLDEFCSLKIPNTTKILVGDGPYLKELKEKYNDVMFVGAKFGKELSSYYANADVFVFTSKTDTFGIVMIESIRCGTPIAAHEVPGPIDIVIPHVNGFMSEGLESAIIKCFSLDREKVLESSKKWTWDECWDIFEKCLVNLH